MHARYTQDQSSTKALDAPNAPSRITSLSLVPFAVIDFETTGFVPERADRVIEVGIVLTTDDGGIEREWTTLVNPKRDVGASHIHGLRGADLMYAPEFSEIADELLDLVLGRTVVAHNATFDMRFLHAELNRAGYPVDRRPPAFDTMKWSGLLVGPAKLQHACEALGISLIDAHSALADAKATAELVARMAPVGSRHPDWAADVARSAAFAWPIRRHIAPCRVLPRSGTASDGQTWLDTVLSAAWIPGVPEDEASYLLVLDRALLDRHISRSEAAELATAAEQAGLSGTTVGRIHREYLRSLAAEALDDGVVTDDERTDLLAVADALGFNASDVADALTWASGDASPAGSTATFALKPGDRVVFTGEISRPREEWLADIVAEGLASGGITKSTKLVVAADPDSLSGKAAKAREYSIPLVDEETFVRLFADYRDRR